jgi:hypothetical protein
MKTWPVVALLAACGSALADEPLSFRGFELGAARAKMIEALPGSTCGTLTCTWRSSDCLKGGRSKPEYDECIRTMKYGPITPSYATATFQADQLVSVMVEIPTFSFETYVTALTEKFGPPSSETTEQLQNRMGATWPNRIVVWSRGDARFRITQRSLGIDTGSIMFVSTEYLRQQDAERKARAKASAKDL